MLQVAILVCDGARSFAGGAVIVTGGARHRTAVLRQLQVVSVLTILKLIVKDVGFLIIKVNVKATVEIKIDVSFFVCMNCSFNFGCIV